MSIIQKLTAAYAQTQDPDQLLKRMFNMGWVPVTDINPEDASRYIGKLFTVAWAYPNNPRSVLTPYAENFNWIDQGEFVRFLRVHTQQPSEIQYFLIPQDQFDRNKLPSFV